MRTPPVLLAVLLAVSGPAAAEEVARVTWDLSLDGVRAGTRTATITTERTGDTTGRTISANTRIDVAIGPVRLVWRQRLNSFGDRVPASFQSVLDENGTAREVQVRWSAEGWTITQVERSGVRTDLAAPNRVDLSTVDLIDPGSRWRLDRYTSARILSAETGDIWEGPVEPLGTGSITVAGAPVAVTGWAWTSPEGRSEFWYSEDGWLVKYEMKLLGHTLEAVLHDAPPQGPDAFAVPYGRPRVDVIDL